MRAEMPEDVFRRVFRRLNPDVDPPAFAVRFRPYAKLRSNVRYDPEARCIRASLSDLLLDAPPPVLDAVVTELLSKLYGKRVPRHATNPYRRWLNTPLTQQRMLDARRTRGRKQLLSPAGQAHDLSALFDQLNGRHFGGALRKPTLGWSMHAARRQLGHYDPAHDTIVINRVLDRRGVPPLALEYVLFHEMLHVKHPVRIQGNRRCVHSPEFLAEERRFPGYDEARRILESMRLPR